jgi:hypothetical protein
MLGKPPHLLKWGNVVASRDTVLRSPATAMSGHQICKGGTPIAALAVSTSASLAITAAPAASLVEPAALIDPALIVVPPKKGGKPTWDARQSKCLHGLHIERGGEWAEVH